MHRQCGRLLAVAGAMGLSLAAPAAAGAAAAPFPPAASVPTTWCQPGQVLGGWSLQRLAAQTIAFPVEEDDLPAAAPAAAAGYGGLVLFGTSAPADLGAQLASLRAHAPSHLGLLVMTDEEGGGIQRMANLVGSMPWAAQMGATMSPAQIRALTRAVGKRMAANGVDMDLAPVLDVDGRAVEPGPQDPDGFRSFSGNTGLVSEDGLAYLQGMEAGGVVPVVKHFPGLGGASGNTDDGPATTLPWSQLQQVAIPPFRTAVDAGVPAVMIANAVVPGLTSVPASLSSAVVGGVLRGQLGFRGLVVTDSLSAGAIADPPLSLRVPAAAVDALAAGDDLLLFGSTGSTAGDLQLASETVDAIVSAVGSGRITKGQLVAAAQEVLDAKGVDVCPPVVGIAATPGGKGYWLAAADGAVRASGDAPALGSLTGTPSRPIVGIAATPDGRGYWLVGADGGVFSFGDARFRGSTGGMHLNAPVVGMAATRDGGGYWLVAADGGIFSFGDARFHGSAGGTHLNAPVVGMAADGATGGYWLVASDGGIFSYGAPFRGSAGSLVLASPVAGMSSAPDGSGYRLVARDGGVFCFGQPYSGSFSGHYLPLPVTSIAGGPAPAGYRLAGEDGSVYAFG